MLRKIWVLLVCAGVTASFGRAYSGTLEDLKTKGEMVVGTKADYPPYGFRDAQGNIVGIEPDLAADIARRLNVKLRLEPVLSSNRLDLLRQGRVDLIIATMNITEDRQRQAGIVEPPYYGSGAAVLGRHDAHIEAARDLSGKTVCAVDGNIVLRELRAQYPAVRASVFKDVSAAEAALSSDQCQALLFDDTLLFYMKQTDPGRWKDYDFVSLIEFDPSLWGIAVRSDDRNSPWASFVSQAIIDWHRSGRLMEIERKWLGANTPLLKSLNIKWSGLNSISALQQ